MLVSIAKNSSILMGSNVLVAGMLIVQAVIMTRALGDRGFGLLTLVTTFVLTLEQLLDSRVWHAVIRYVSRYYEQGDIPRASAALKLFYLVDAVTAVFKLLVLASLADWAARVLLDVPMGADWIRFFSLVVVINFSTETSQALLRLNNRYWWLALHNLGIAFLRLGSGVALWLISPTVGFMLVLMLATSLISAITIQGLAWHVMRAMKLEAGASLGLLRGEYRGIASFIFASNLDATNRLLPQRVDVLLLGWLTPPAVVAHYELAKRLVMQVSTLLNSGVQVSIYPEIARAIARKEFALVMRLQGRISALALGFTLPPTLLGMLLAPLVIPLVFGPAFTGAVPIFQVLIWQLLSLSLVWFSAYMLAIGKIHLLVGANIFLTVLYIMMLLLFIPVWGGVGAAAAYMLRVGVGAGIYVMVTANVNRRIRSGAFVPT